MRIEYSHFTKQQHNKSTVNQCWRQKYQTNICNLHSDNITILTFLYNQELLTIAYTEKAQHAVLKAVYQFISLYVVYNIFLGEYCMYRYLLYITRKLSLLALKWRLPKNSTSRTKGITRQRRRVFKICSIQNNVLMFTNNIRQ